MKMIPAQGDYFFFSEQIAFDSWYQCKHDANKILRCHFQRLQNPIYAYNMYGPVR